jgi:hypothetical protein
MWQGQGKHSMQLEVPNSGYGSPSRPTSRRLELVADWIEAQALLADSAISKARFVDVLDDAGLVTGEEDGWRLVNDAYARCRSRMRNLGEAYPLVVAGAEIEKSNEALAYRFCLLASLPEQLTLLRSAYSTEFRDLFEELTAVSLDRSLPLWSVLHTGWSNIAAAGRGSVVRLIADEARARTHDPSVFPHANDAQVDIAAFWKFTDGRAGYPVLLGQCATGVTDWQDKAVRPNLDRWIKAVQFSATPSRFFAVPFSLDDETFSTTSFECNGLLLDRMRICKPLAELPADLSRRVGVWMESAVRVLPLAA